MSTPVEPELRHSLGTGLTAFRDNGMLWALNTYCLHGQGYEIRVDGDEVFLYGYGDKVRSWQPADCVEGGAVDGAWRAFRQALLDAQTPNNPGHWDGHSPGFNKQHHGQTGQKA